MAATSTLRDDFNDGSRNTSLWNEYGTVSESGGVLTITGTTGAAAYGGYSSINQYDLTSSYVFSRLLDPGNQSIASWQASPVLLTLDASNTLSWYVNAGLIHAQKQVSGSYADVKGDVSYDAAVHKWFRIRESGGTIYWDYSTNGKTWTNYTSLANPFAVTALYVDCNAGHYASEVSSTTAAFDNLNILPKKSITILGVG